MSFVKLRYANYTDINRKICRKWNTLVYDGSLWTSIDATPFHKSLPIEVIIKLIKSSSRFLKTANFR